MLSPGVHIGRAGIGNQDLNPGTLMWDAGVPNGI